MSRFIARGLFLHSFKDQNSQDASKVLFEQLDGTICDPGVSFEPHGGNGLRLTIGNANAEAGDVFEVSDAGQTVTSPAGNSRIVIREA